jgi:hypothetical protein
MSKLPTDRTILKYIYEMYESAYPGAKPGSARGENDPYIAIDVPSVAAKLGCKAELLFGRLYYHLDYKYRYKQDDGSLVPLFYLKVGDKRHAVHFPYLAAILAGLQQEHRKQLWSLGISILALVLSVASLAVNFYKR